MYCVKRNVVYSTRAQNTVEVWGIDRPAPDLPCEAAPRDTNADDPLAPEDTCSTVLLLLRGYWVTWDRFPEWLSFAEEVGYELVSGYKKLSPYSSIMIKSRC